MGFPERKRLHPDSDGPSLSRWKGGGAPGIRSEASFTPVSKRRAGKHPAPGLVPIAIATSMSTTLQASISPVCLSRGGKEGGTARGACSHLRWHRAPAGVGVCPPRGRFRTGKAIILHFQRVGPVRRLFVVTPMSVPRLSFLSASNASGRGVFNYSSYSIF